MTILRRLSLVLLAGLTATTACTRSARPNILLFLIDDLGWQDTSVPMHTACTPLNDRYRTPNLERLADRGMEFTNAYAVGRAKSDEIGRILGW